ncbi:von Willebrand factor type A domain-containing protein [Danxiaibacter flavus]|uniref:von Willebrand factor type A domain-containing protein n=1 Tax=Danxiaibacter flavus TaxID=3049108 RepID=A0ABV3ZCM8_9BACT|nr:von Willebrand factor type A domain-containing protein [Chitinophagaceae bacterium DXS]
MKKIQLAILLGLFISSGLQAQYYLRGEVHDEEGKIMPNVRINLISKGGMLFYTGTAGTFGIPLSTRRDTIVLRFDKYEEIRQQVEADKFQSFSLKPLKPVTVAHRLSSQTKNLSNQVINRSYYNNETYNTLVENSFVNADKFPETGFALFTDRASYSNIRRFLNMNEKVPPDAVRIEEMLNYFQFATGDKAASDSLFSYSSKLTTSPWDENKQLLYINLQAPKIKTDNVEPTNFVFLIDVSGSMDKENRLPLIQTGLKLLVQNLRAKDSVSIVVYGGNVGIKLQPTSGAEKKKIVDVIDGLVADGDTPGEAAIKTAYDLAKRSYNAHGNNRVILATDGDFNVGQSSEDELEKLITNKRQEGIYLTCLGVGMGNYKDSKLETLAKKGNGNFAYIDNYQEIEKVLIEEFTKTVYTVANEASMNVCFNPSLVKSYRLIGYNNKIEAISDTSSNLEGGTVGSGHSIVALFEITKWDGVDESTWNESENVASIHLQFKPCRAKYFVHQDFKCTNTLIDNTDAKSCEKLATVIVMFGQLLKQSPYAEYTWNDLLRLSSLYVDRKSTSEKELVAMIEKANKIYTAKKKKKLF